MAIIDPHRSPQHDCQGRPVQLRIGQSIAVVGSDQAQWMVPLCSPFGNPVGALTIDVLENKQLSCHDWP